MSDKVISTYTLSTTWRTSTTAYFLYQNGDSTYYKAELSGYVSSLSSQLAIITADISSLSTDKADIAQSSFINVTYSSNWVDISTQYPPTSYKKDTLGYVHLRVASMNGNSNPIANLPAGYIPNYSLIYSCYSVITSSGVNPVIIITSSGGINAQNHTNGYVHSGEVIYSPST